MSTTRVPFHFVDVFALEPLTGNPLAVVDGGADLPDDVLKRIAREFNQSETTFVMAPTVPGADARFRSFTAAGVEVFGAGGHNSLGAWWWLADTGRVALPLTENAFGEENGTRIWPVTITQAHGRPLGVVMNQGAPTSGRQVLDLAPLTTALGLEPGDISIAGVPCQVMATAAAHLMVPIRDRATVDRIQPDARALFAVLHGLGAEGCYTFSLDPTQPGASAYARFFNPTVGISEDPATGTAAGPLAALLVAHGVCRPGQTVVIEQGTTMGRTSLIRVDVGARGVSVSGRGVVAASGHLLL